jgi:hypothetical protein
LKGKTTGAGTGAQLFETNDAFFAALRAYHERGEARP